jgi:hypothetical protein
MISEKQIAANRRNARRSTGPKTEEGKNRSKLNAVRHNLTGQVTAMTEPDRAAYNQHLQSMLADLDPQGAMELQLAMQLASATWRLNRSAAIEDNIFALGLNQEGGHFHEHEQIDAAFTTAFVYTREAAALQLLSLYEHRLNRRLHADLAQLKALQAERKAAQPVAEDRRAQAAAEAQALTQLTETQAVALPNGFVFSNRKPSRAERRRQRLAVATQTENPLLAAQAA